MMKIEIKTGGAAFCDENGKENIICENVELSRILHKLADEIRYSNKRKGSMNDINGNKVLVWNRN